MTMKPALHLELDIDLGTLGNAADSVREFLERYAVPPKAVYESSLVLEEIAGNIIRHGNATGKIEIFITIQGRKIQMTFIDNSFRFDPAQAPPSAISDSAAKTRIGGLGIHMVRSVVDHMAYHRTDSRNQLTLHIPIEHPPVHEGTGFRSFAQESNSLT